jgi:hypothetical protein
MNAKYFRRRAGDEGLREEFLFLPYAPAVRRVAFKDKTSIRVGAA